MGGHLRYVWIIKVQSSSNKQGYDSDKNVIFTRKFPSGEKRAKQEGGSHYSPIPSVSQLVPLILTEVCLTSGDAQKFNPSRDSCCKPVSDPVYKIETANGTLWPLIAIDKSGYLFCCLSVVDSKPDVVDITKTPLINIPSIAEGFALLTALAEFLSVPSQEISNRIADLPIFINEAAPFGVVRDANADNIVARLNNKPCVLPKSHKIPAWKASSHKGKSSLNICVVERIKASQVQTTYLNEDDRVIRCAQETWEDSQEIYGTITCKAELDGSSSDVSLSIVHQGEGLGVPLDGLIIHPCVQRADWQDLENSANSRKAPRRLRFCPPSENFSLCHYTVSQLKELPIFGVYHMKPEDSKVSLTVMLKLSDQVKNNFELCELHIPFYTRSPISHIEGNPTQGSVYISSNKRVVVWNIGQKFASKGQEVTLSSTVTFSGSEQGLPAPTVEDNFCRGHNSYAQLFFKIQDFTHSGCHVDPKSIQVTPATKFKLSLSREYSSSDYKIWNSSGEGLTTNSSNPSKHLTTS